MTVLSTMPTLYYKRMKVGRSTCENGDIHPMGDFFTRAELVCARSHWKRAGKTVVFTNGCYDILHPGHIRLLEQARSLGDVLILALNTDDSVARLKGPTRPLLSETERIRMAL